jgi:hypothetical protein
MAALVRCPIQSHDGSLCATRMASVPDNGRSGRQVGGFYGIARNGKAFAILRDLQEKDGEI